MRDHFADSTEKQKRMRLSVKQPSIYQGLTFPLIDASKKKIGRGTYAGQPWNSRPTAPACHLPLPDSSPEIGQWTIKIWMTSAPSSKETFSEVKLYESFDIQQVSSVVTREKLYEPTTVYRSTGRTIRRISGTYKLYNLKCLPDYGETQRLSIFRLAEAGWNSWLAQTRKRRIRWPGPSTPSTKIKV